MSGWNRSTSFSSVAPRYATVCIEERSRLILLCNLLRWSVSGHKKIGECGMKPDEVERGFSWVWEAVEGSPRAPLALRAHVIMEYFWNAFFSGLASGEVLPFPASSWPMLLSTRHRVMLGGAGGRVKFTSCLQFSSMPGYLESLQSQTKTWTLQVASFIHPP